MMGHFSKLSTCETLRIYDLVVICALLSCPKILSVFFFFFCFIAIPGLLAEIVHVCM